MFKLISIFLIIFFSSYCNPTKTKLQELPIEWKYAKIEKGELPDFGSEKEFQLLKDSKSLAELVSNQKGYLLLKGSFQLEQILQVPTSISLGKIIHSEAIYLNQFFLISNLSIDENEWNFWNLYRVISVPSELLKIGENFIYLKIYIDSEGSVEDSILIGPSLDIDKEIFKKMFFESYFNGIIAFLFLVISAYHLLIYLKRKKDKENLYYTVFSFSFSIYCFNFVSFFIPKYFSMSYLVFQKIIFLSMFASSYSLYRFISVFLKRNDRKWFFYLYIGFALIPQIIILFAPSYSFMYKTRSITSFFLLPFLGYILFIPVYNFIKYKSPEAKAMLFSLVIVFCASAHDILNVVIKLHEPFWLGIAIPLFMASIMFLLGNKFVEVHNQTDELNENLENKVKERTKEVIEKMELINNLKVQQDGDYYLTSLIAKPLGTNFNKSKSILTEFYLEQKKKFDFKNKNAELGGDICITSNLRFGDGKNRHVFFFNGDAMGKSMQGAGGAIVAGTVLNNILARSARNNKVQKISQAEWITEVYLELNNVFSSFSGSMLMSCACGLIDEKTKKMWYFNAEHPYTVLYRDGKASFIESAVELRKLGTVIEGNEFQLFEFQLANEDILYIGSDGRDDINMNPENERDINQDETLFLKNIEYNKADLKKIIHSVHTSGKVTDDLSLIKVSIFEQLDMNSKDQFDEIQEQISSGDFEKATSNLKEILNSDKENLKALEMISSVYYEKKNYLEAIRYFNEIISISQNDYEVLFNLSLCYKYLKDYETSILLSEKVFLNNPKKISNLINLADSYRIVGKNEKSRELLNKVNEVIPFFESAMKLDRLLKTKGA